MDVKNLGLKSLLLAMALTLSASPAFSRDINSCSRTEVVGAAYVYLPYFGEDMKDLRFFCDAISQIREASDIVWNLSDRSYECRVGNFCINGGG